MKKESFNFLKTLASLEKCIGRVQDDVEQMLSWLPDNADIDRQDVSQRAENLSFWLNRVINEYDA